MRKLILGVVIGLLIGRAISTNKAFTAGYHRAMADLDY